MVKIDVCINVYGKPFQTILTVKSLLRHSSEHIDKIYLVIEDKESEKHSFSHVPSINTDELTRSIGYKDLIIFHPRYHLFGSETDNVERMKTDVDYRLSMRYQYGIEKTDKKYILIMHNDCIVTGDIVSDYLNEIKDNAGIGLIGQCWNCPAFFAKKCDGYRHAHFTLDYDEVMSLVSAYPPKRGNLFLNNLVKEKPMPLPECRLNEFICLLNTEYIRKECIPQGVFVPFGSGIGVDIATLWFRQMIDKGYLFEHYDYNKRGTAIHAPFGKAGHDSMLKEERYISDERDAYEYLQKHFDFKIKKQNRLTSIIKKVFR